MQISTKQTACMAELARLKLPFPNNEMRPFKTTGTTPFFLQESGAL